MAEEQVLRSEPPPPPPPKANHNKSSGGGEGEPAGDDKLVFWVERLAACLLISCWVPSNPCHFLLPAVFLLIFSNSFYFLNFIYPQESVARKKTEQTRKKLNKRKLAKFDFSLNESKEEVKARDERNKMNEENTGQEKAGSKDSKEEAKAKDKGNNKIDEENTGQEKAKLDFSLNESKEEVKAKDGRNKMDEEKTGQEKASSKESKEEVKPKDEGNDEIDEEITGREKAKLDLSLKVSQEEVEAKDGRIINEFHGWEEERSQLMYELGAARASMEIYRELLHDLHHHHQP